MYIPAAFEESDPEILFSLIEACPLATVITHTRDHGLFASHIPLHLDRTGGRHGVLRGHVSRANPQARYLVEHAGDVLVVFAGPQAYITPSLYEEKARSGRVVPTWNYAVVHVYAAASMFEDEARLQHHLESLTNAHERDRERPWQLADAPTGFVAGQMKGIIGVLLEIRRIEGKWKMSQNRSEADTDAIADSLTQAESEETRMVGDMVRRHRPIR